MTNQNNNTNGKKTIEETEAEKKHAIIVDELMEEVRAMYRRNAHLFPNGDPTRASPSYIPRPEPEIRIGDPQFPTFSNIPSDPRENPTWKPRMIYPYRLEDIEHEAMEHNNHIEGYAKGLVARAKLDTAREQSRKALENRREANVVEDWTFWDNQRKHYETMVGMATEELARLGENANLGPISE